MNESFKTMVANLKAMKAEGWQYLEVKQLAEILARHREKLRLAVREYRMHKRTHAAEHDAIEKLYLGYEGMFLRDHLRDALRLYVMINHDYHEARKAYMDSLKGPEKVSLKPMVVVEVPPTKKATPRGRKAA